MTNLTHAIVLDFESTCDDVEPPRPQEIIEFPSVLVRLEPFGVVDEFMSFVRPYHHPTLSESCRKLTSITQADVDDAPLFPEAYTAHGRWLADHGVTPENAVFVTCGDWDLDTMLPLLGLPLVGTHHRGLDDCRNIASILEALLQRGLSVRPTN